MFDTLQDRLAATFKSLRGKGRLSEADIDADGAGDPDRAARGRRQPGVVKDFVAAVKERARGAELSGALNPGQQIIKIVNDELIAHPRRRDPGAPVRQATADGDHARRPAGLRQDDAGRQARGSG